MKRPLIVYPDIRPITRIFYVRHLRDFFSQYFDMEIYNPAKTYDKQNTIFVKRLQQTDAWLDRYEELKQQGYKVLLEHVEECPDTPMMPQRPAPGDHVLYCQRWFWYNDCLMYRYNDYHLYQPNRDLRFKGFMPISRHRPWRYELVQAMGSRLDDFIWSYNERQLPNDTRSTEKIHWRFYFNPEWYDHTYFSLVAETMVKEQGFITEKTLKPLAFRHPFLVLGQKHTLKLLHQWGFETYDNLWDESYDDVDHFRDRIKLIINNIDQIIPGTYDKITQEKFQHNHAHFFNTELVHQGLKKDIVDPVLEIVEKR